MVAGLSPTFKSNGKSDMGIPSAHKVGPCLCSHRKFRGPLRILEGLDEGVVAIMDISNWIISSSMLTPATTAYHKGDGEAAWG